MIRGAHRNLNGAYKRKMKRRVVVVVNLVKIVVVFSVNPKLVVIFSFKRLYSVTLM